jgi:Double zinc ribbon
MPTLAYFGINSSGLSLAINLAIVFLVVLYASLVYWTYADARRRILDPMLVGCAVVVSLFPFVGTVVYIILRPPEYLEDVRERELEVQAAEVRLQQLDHSLCPHCDHHIERDFLRCPSCLRKLKERCASCQRPLERTWSICPYCEAEVPGATQARRTARRRERSGRAASAPAPAARRAIESEAQTDEGEMLLDEESLTRESLATSANANANTNAGTGAKANAGATLGEDSGARKAAPASKSGSAARGAPRAGRPRPSS